MTQNSQGKGGKCIYVAKIENEKGGDVACKMNHIKTLKLDSLVTGC